jgi:hypothetical protein
MTTRREFLGTVSVAGAALAVTGDALFEGGAAHARQPAAPLVGHFHPKGKAPSQHTIEMLKAAR